LEVDFLKYLANSRTALSGRLVHFHRMYISTRLVII